LNQARIVQLLKEKSEALRNQPRPQVVAFYGEEAVDRLLSDLDHLPHLFLLSCLADQQIRAQRASWIPVELGRLIGGHRFEDFAALRREDYQRLFQENRLHRFNEKMAGILLPFSASGRSMTEMLPGSGGITRAARRWCGAFCALRGLVSRLRRWQRIFWRGSFMFRCGIMRRLRSLRMCIRGGCSIGWGWCILRRMIMI
jgi:hypothetical protein